jgi:hypothetical protein
MQPLGHLSEWPPQQLTQPFLLVSFPRQGTDWFMGACPSHASQPGVGRTAD